jgi:hypothetical protein
MKKETVDRPLRRIKKSVCLNEPKRSYFRFFCSIVIHNSSCISLKHYKRKEIKRLLSYRLYVWLTIKASFCPFSFIFMWYFQCRLPISGHIDVIFFRVKLLVQTKVIFQIVINSGLLRENERWAIVNCVILDLIATCKRA